MNVRIKIVFSLILLINCTLISMAQTVVPHTAVDMTPIEFSVEGSDEGQLSPQKWFKLGLDTIDIDGSEKIFWGRYNIKNATKDSIIVLEFPHWSDVTLYWGDEIVGRAGSFVPVKERSLTIANGVYIQMSLLPGEAMQLRAKMKASKNNLELPTTLTIQAQSYDYIFERSSEERQYVAFFLGIYFFIILYNFFVMVVIKSRAYMLYVLLIAINFFALPHNFGYTIEYFSAFDQYPHWHPVVDMIFSSLFGFAIMAFASEFLRIRKNFPRTHKIFQVIRILLVLVLIPSFMGETFLAYNLSSLIGLFTFGVVLTVSIRSYKRGYHAANYFLLAFSFFVLGMFVFLFKEMGVLPEMVWTKYSMQIGTTIEAVLFAVALGDRINRLQIENKEQQLQLIDELKKNEQLQKEVNMKLERKVQQRTLELQMKNIELEYSNKQITDSLNYAKSIQTSILESHNALDKNAIQNFVLFQPRDIVSGDFYWSHQVNNDTILWITADCTGHGVPGALMSIVGNVLLNKIVIERGISKVNVLLSQLGSEIDKTMNKSDDLETRMDGIDMSVCRLDTRTMRLTFAGANARMWIVRDGIINEYKGDKQPVGFFHNMTKPFIEQEIQLQKGDMIYTFTDGYPDQFGGPQGKKYGYMKFRQLILEIHELNMEEQQTYFQRELDKWKGNIEQLDDITVIGVGLV